jgi:DNA replication and repair protein RecF
VQFKKGQKKVLKRNGKSYDKFSDHIIPLVVISPADRDLIVEGSETRRNSWIASSLSWIPII